MKSPDVDVLIIGAGPVGLTLANLLGARGRSALVLEQRATLIDYPRGVGLDDESIRTLATAGLWERIERYTVPQHVVRFVNGKGQVLATNDPQTREFGYVRKHGFIQPLVDQELAAGLDRFAGTELRFGHRVAGLTEHADGVDVTVEVLDADEQVVGTEVLTASYVVGAEGGRSFTRGWLGEHHGVEFEGKSPSTRWLVVDVENDPIGTPSVYLGADPRRPYVSIGLPLGIRRWEFMLFDDEPTELVDTPEFRAELLAPHVPDPAAVSIINQRVFTHHGRVATSFRKGRVMLAGDAAHLMPVWLGQGWNSGIRDATNLAWKLTAVLRGEASEDLLDTYTSERHGHVAAMIDVNMAAGSIMKCGPVKGWLRDRAATALNVVPSVKAYFSELRFKPMPRYDTGVVVDQATLTPGRSDVSFKPGSLKPGALKPGKGLRRRSAAATALHPFTDSAGAASPVGLQFIQPRVSTASANDVLLDEATGDWWTLAAWGNDPARLLSDEDLALVERLGIRLVAFYPETQRAWAEERFAASPTTVVGDTTGALKDWFDTRACGFVVLRPDRFVAAASLAQQASQAFRATLTAASYDVAERAAVAGVLAADIEPTVAAAHTGLAGLTEEVPA
ncbi:bifunctional 3-(3-hydroxy-phenyl)propionate/3-hydroxycinnamic acid hydroxylase [Nocardioides sp. zg-ZUI104]|uniref:bifunctional 3-(3-hydroxy-phenyl)propionate/3-hydroxycinnamic acid hydroxylase MhpA n=1 Tax=Nocardioides faecalis TaxID=2803858 RepID=UPI001BCE4EF7|nr:bifunctional 3-(3-hydroxy-phenyl)propionate/3-hydroxycinnamic acid hydroxylase [Nocardioides faecalis]MBS4752978.1 bifunctional 3-(3-hydroxy-phenyl)propionate/3-hydroxycinnamic acid hydroxylase [Nocardioides faecalis]